jgi:hypothetical protein
VFIIGEAGDPITPIRFRRAKVVKSPRSSVESLAFGRKIAWSPEDATQGTLPMVALIVAHLHHLVVLYELSPKTITAFPVNTWISTVHH